MVTEIYWLEIKVWLSKPGGTSVVLHSNYVVGQRRDQKASLALTRAEKLQ